MTRDQIEAVLERVRSWPENRQADLARIVKHMEEQDAVLPPEDDGTRAAIAEGLAQARRGEFVPDEEMAAFFKSHGL